MKPKIEPRLPSAIGQKPVSPELQRLVGATITAIGAAPQGARRFEGGGLVVEYRPPGSAALERITFAFNELGLWIEGG